MKYLLSIFLSTFLLVGCGSGFVSDGHKGIGINWDNTVEPDEYPAGFNFKFAGNIKEAAANEITVPIMDIHPQTADKAVLSDMDVNLIYEVTSDRLADLYVSVRGRHRVAEDGVILPMYNYVENVAMSAIADAVAKVNALDANQKRDALQADIVAAIGKKLEVEQLQGIIKIKQVIIKNLLIPESVKVSAEKAITAQNELAAKEYEVQTAVKEAARIKLLSGEASAGYVAYLNAQANMVKAQAIADAVKSGKVPNWIVPENWGVVTK